MTRPVPAMQWDGTAENAGPIVEWIRSHDHHAAYQTAPIAHISISLPGRGRVSVDPHDIVVRRYDGSFYPYAPHVFDVIFEKVTP